MHLAMLLQCLKKHSGCAPLYDFGRQQLGACSKDGMGHVRPGGARRRGRLAPALKMNIMMFIGSGRQRMPFKFAMFVINTQII